MTGARGRDPLRGGVEADAGRAGQVSAADLRFAAP